MNFEEIEEYINKCKEKICDKTLYVVSTPIGNINDISFRALYILKNCDLIAAEDTRKISILLKHYGIKKHLISYFVGNQTSRIDFLINELISGKKVALVSDAGTPCISDPGSILISKCIERGINIKPVPGASSLIHSLVMSGFNTDKFYFQGFLPHKGRRSILENLKQLKMVIVIFESKYKIKSTIKELKEFFRNKNIAICRELTKMFEEVYRGKVKDININKIKEKGEFVIVINNISP
ncbi:MAG: 16S rRNA (cytidine(1402)-2'-O)-methyltransferase [Ignavibacteria bacterium]|nr:16S rRNA (cytidine(1402)-2'-O)-methyltransferase [Ignavibacteria bacterium]